LTRAFRIAFALGLLLAALAAETRSVWDGVYTVEQARRGEAAYARECASCHGTALSGGESAPPLAGGDFLSNWLGLTAADLFERIRVTMPANNPGRLSRELNADILAYLLSMNQFPPGSSELQREPQLLRQILLEAR
jgi:mono/diheme cytochrome c family protein